MIYTGAKKWNKPGRKLETTRMYCLPSIFFLLAWFFLTRLLRLNSILLFDFNAFRLFSAEKLVARVNAVIILNYWLVILMPGFFAYLLYSLFNAIKEKI